MMTWVAGGWTIARIGRLCAYLLVLVQLCSCGESGEQPKVSHPIRPVKTLVLATPSKDDRIELPGEIQVPAPVSLAFEQVSGEIVELPIAGREGQMVMKGELLAQIDPADFETTLGNAEDELQKAYSVLDSARAENERMEKMRRITPDLITDSMLERTQARLSEADSKIKSLEEEVRRAERLLEQSSLRAPFAGLLVRCLAEPGQKAQPNESILSLQDMTHLDVILDASEGAAAAVRDPASDGISAVARFPSVPNKAFPLQLKRAATTPVLESDNDEIVFQMDKSNGVELPEGTVGTVTLTSNGQVLGTGTLLIPAIAVLTDPDGTSFVWIVDETDMLVHRRDIRMGRLAGSDQVQVLSGLEGGEQIIIAGVTQLTEGQQVRLWEERESGKVE